MLFKLKVALRIVVENKLFVLHFNKNFKHSSYEKSPPTAKRISNSPSNSRG